MLGVSLEQFPGVRKKNLGSCRFVNRKPLIMNDFLTSFGISLLNLLEL